MDQLFSDLYLAKFLNRYGLFQQPYEVFPCEVECIFHIQYCELIDFLPFARRISLVPEGRLENNRG